MLGTQNFLNNNVKETYVFIINLIKFGLNRETLLFIINDYKALKDKSLILVLLKDIFAQEYFDKVERYIGKISKTLNNKNIFEYIEIPFYNNYLFKIHGYMHVHKKDINQSVTSLLQYYENKRHSEINRVVDTARESYISNISDTIVKRIKDMDNKDIFIHNNLFILDNSTGEYVHNFHIPNPDNLSKYFSY